jgi:hypothetical protein
MLRASRLILALVLLAFSASAETSYAQGTSQQSSKSKICRGEMYSAEFASDPHFKDATWIGECFFKKSNIQAARLILEECHYHRPCLVEATTLDTGEILEVQSVKLDGHDMTCRGNLISTDKESGDTAKIGPCNFTIDGYTGITITDKCRFGSPCTVQARIVGAEITHVYSVQPGR